MRTEWPKVTIECPEGIERAILLYWIDLLSPKKGQWVHPQDKKKQAEIVKRLKAVLALEFF